MAKKREQLTHAIDINKITVEGKKPPQAKEVERAVLGGMLLDKYAVTKAIELLYEDVFHSEANRKIYQTMVNLFERGTPIDIVTVTESMQANHILEEVGGAYYISELSQAITSAANIEAHCYILIERAILRGIIAVSNEAITSAYSESEDALNLLDKAEQRIFQLSERKMRKSAISLHEAVHRVMDKVDKIHGKHDGITGIPSGYKELDEVTGGFQNSDLIIIAGRPSQGKTAFALNIAHNASLHREKKTSVAIFSLEMATDQLVQRLISSEARINQNSIQRGRLTTDDMKRLARAAGVLYDAKIFIDDSPAPTILEIRAKSRRLKTEHGIGLIIVDYLQLIHAAERIDSREQQISLISRSLKALAKELKVPVVALSQLNRGIETRTGEHKRPQLSDLRESGAIEQDADLVIFVHRPETHNVKEITDKYGNKISSEGIAQIIIGKHRNGPQGEFILRFEKELTSFKEMDTVHDDKNIPPEAIGDGGTPF
ncbi:MAG: replicative DNA helicase [Ignavibacteria bacterium]|nr:replicative DNA helicase [Ignavibacteria bacterium]